MAAAQIFVYVGGYAPAEEQGIRVFRLDADTGALTPAGGASGVANPSFLEVGPGGTRLYAASEVGDFNGLGTGAVAALALTGDGAVSVLGHESSGSGGPCHVSVAPDGGSILVANYGGGAVARLPVAEDGGLRAPSAVAKHEGPPSKTHPGRQERCHAHSITPHPSGRFAVACDLGADKLYVYKLDGDALTPNDPPHADTKPGAGPRHLAFSADGRAAYVINELDNTLSVWSVDPDSGALSEVQSVPTLPGGFEGKNTTAEVRLHPSGRFVYGSNRGHDSIAVFAVEDPATGRLSPAAVQHEPTRGKTPRNFNIDPSGRWLIAANQDSGTLAVFSVDPDTGRLAPVGEPVPAGKPTCVRFVASPAGG